MKVLRIYDHLGELKKEFNIYVEGEDFLFQTSYPEPLWLGTIILEDAGKEPSKPIKEFGKPLESGLVVEEVAITGEFAPEVVNVITKIEPIPKEVKHEPKKVHRKRSRVKRTPPPSNSKSIKVIHQDDPGGHPSPGD